MGADFDHPLAPSDAGLSPDTDTAPDLSTVPPDENGLCSSDRKLCDGQCVSKTNPQYGCDGASCAPCSVARGSAKCVSGACAVASCGAPYKDCNDSIADGCEVNTESSGEHCGRCGNRCGSGLVCSDGACSSSCANGKIACGSSCVDTQTDPEHCGSCNACPAPPNGVATCQTGTCGFSCNGGYTPSGASCVANQPHDVWQTVASMPTKRRQLVAAVADGRIFAIGGNDRPVSAGYLTTVEAYSPSTNQWQTITSSMPSGRSGLAAAVAPDGRIFAIGGYRLPLIGSYYDDLSTVEAYNANTNQWQTGLASMPTERRQPGAAVAPDGRIFVIGGYDGTSDLSTVEAYNANTNKWQTGLASMPTKRSGVGAAVAPDGRIFVIGGYDGTSELSTVEAYDPSTNQWQIGLASMPTKRSYLAAVVTSDGRIFAIGGYDGTSDVSTVEAYNPSTNKWQTVASMPTKRSELAAAVAPDGRIFAVGGKGGAFLSTVEAYTP